MSKSYLKLPVDGPVTEVVIEDHEDELEVLQGIVGGLIEGVGLPDGYMVYVNETGLIEELPMNEYASMMSGMTLFGDAVMVGPVDREGNTESVEPSVLKYMLGSRND